MAKMLAKVVEMDCTLHLNERETEMLAWLAGYGGSNIAEAIAVKLTSKFSREEWDGLWQVLRGELERTNEHFRNVRLVFNGQKIAADRPKKETL